MENRTVDDLCFDLQEELSRKWKREFPDGKLPDRIGSLLSDVRKAWYYCLSTKKQIDKNE